MTAKPRVLVVDDSAFARTVIARLLRTSDAIDVIGSARDGADALAKVAELDPDVITLDLTMPNIDGLAVLRALGDRPRPRAVVVSISTIENDIGAEALALGAVALISKPSAFADERLAEIGGELVDTVLAVAGEMHPRPAIAPPVLVPPRNLAPPALTPRAHKAAHPVELVAIGTSTGGPQALTRILAGLPAGLAAPVAIVLHIPVGYTGPLAARLDSLSPLEVREAEDGLALVPGRAVLARAGEHLRVARTPAGLVCRLATSPPRQFMPSVDELFASAAAVVGAGTLGVVLTGMGDDGLAGARAIAAANGTLVTEDAASCVVYGMPRCVFEAGLGAVAAPLDAIAHLIGSRV